MSSALVVGVTPQLRIVGHVLQRSGTHPSRPRSVAVFPRVQNEPVNRNYAYLFAIPPLSIYAVPNDEKAGEALVIEGENNARPHDSDCKQRRRSLAFYEAALKPLNIRRSSGSNKVSLIQRLFTGGSWPKTMVRSMNSIGRRYPLVPGTIFYRGHGWNTIRDTTPPMYLIRTGLRSRSSIKASDGTSPRQGTKARQP